MARDIFARVDKQHWKRPRDKFTIFVDNHYEEFCNTLRDMDINHGITPGSSRNPRQVVIPRQTTDRDGIQRQTRMFHELVQGIVRKLAEHSDAPPRRQGFWDYFFHGPKPQPSVRVKAQVKYYPKLRSIHVSFSRRP